MPLWYEVSKCYKIYLVHAKQKHGHGLSHIHVRHQTGEHGEDWYTIEGNKLEGDKTNFDKEIANKIKNNQDDIKDCLILIAKGEKIIPLNKREGK